MIYKFNISFNYEIYMPKIKIKVEQKKIFLYWNRKSEDESSWKKTWYDKRTNKFIRNARGTVLLAKADEKLLKRNFKKLIR